MPKIKTLHWTIRAKRKNALGKWTLSNMNELKDLGNRFLQVEKILKIAKSTEDAIAALNGVERTEMIIEKDRVEIRTYSGDKDEMIEVVFEVEKHP